MSLDTPGNPIQRRLREVSMAIATNPAQQKIGKWPADPWLGRHIFPLTACLQSAENAACMFCHRGIELSDMMIQPSGSRQEMLGEIGVRYTPSVSLWGDCCTQPAGYADDPVKMQRRHCSSGRTSSQSGRAARPHN